MDLVNLKNKQMYFYIALSLLLLISLFLFVRIILPTAKNWYVLRKEIQSKNRELRKRYSAIKQGEQLKEEVLAIENTYGDFSQMFFVKDDIPSAVKEIADISQDLQIEFISLTPQSSQKLEASSSENPEFSLWRTPVFIKIKTNYLKLIDFIERIEKESNKFITIDDLRIKKDPSTLLIHDVEMTVYVYSLLREKT